MRSFINLIVVIVIVCMCGACSTPQSSPNEIKVQQVSSYYKVTSTTIEDDGHTYKLFFVSGTSYGERVQILHDPNCICMKHGNNE